MPTVTNPVQNDYRILYDTCIIKPEKFGEIDGIISKMLASKGRYDAVANSTGIPWTFIAITHCMEGSLSFSRHLHNGDPLTARTVQVPKGRPLTGTPPFTWEESAVDALKFDGFTEKNDWSIPGMLHSFEKFNGMGYRKRGINSPYLWSCSNHYIKGKFTADGKFDPNAVSKQIGAAVILKRMGEVEVPVKRDPNVIARIRQLGEEVLFDPDNFSEKAAQLQRLLNSIGNHLTVDGEAGRNTSDAYRSVSGKFLRGDSRGEN